MLIDFDEFLVNLDMYVSGKMTKAEFDAKYPEPDYTNKELYPHGKCIDIKHDTYHDVYTYEDGFEEFDSIGD